MGLQCAGQSGGRESLAAVEGPPRREVTALTRVSETLRTFGALSVCHSCRWSAVTEPSSLAALTLGAQPGGVGSVSLRPLWEKTDGSVRAAPSPLTPVRCWAGTHLPPSPPPLPARPDTPRAVSQPGLFPRPASSPQPLGRRREAGLPGAGRAGLWGARPPPAAGAGTSLL